MTRYEYDPLGNLTQVIDPRGGVTRYVYDRQQRLIEQLQPDPASGLPAVSTKFSYDAAGQLLSVTDPLGRKTQYGYDAFGRVIRELGPAPAAGQSAPLRSFGYDAAGNLRIAVDALRNGTEYRYDQRDRLLAVVEADPDGAGGPLPAPTTRFSYDAVGQRLSSVDPLGRSTGYTYDRLGRTTAVTLPDPDGAGPQLAPQTVSAYDAYGDLTASRQRLQQAGGAVTELVTQYAYDRLGRVVRTTDPNQAVTSFAYDLAGNRTQITDPVGNDTTFVYDSLNRVVQERNELGDSRLFRYDAAGNLIPRTDRNGRAVDYQYDYLNRRTSETWSGSSYVAAYTYDLAGQLLQATDPAATYNYTYDKLGRATTITPSVSWSKTRGAMRSGWARPPSAGPGLMRLCAVSAWRSWRVTTIWDSAAKPISPVSSGTSVPILTAAPSG